MPISRSPIKGLLNTLENSTNYPESVLYERGVCGSRFVIKEVESRRDTTDGREMKCGESLVCAKEIANI